MNPRIVVGVDGSEPSVAALAWAARVARARGASLHVVSVVADVAVASSLDGVWAVLDDVERATAAAQEEALGAVDLLGIDVTTAVPRGHPTAELRRAAEGATMLVVGTHGHGAVGAALLGSTSRQLVTHAVGPVVVVPSDPGRLDRIVVGVDGSEEALHALRWARDLARDAGATIEVVCAYQVPLPIGSPWVPPVQVGADHELHDAAVATIDTAVEKADADDVVVERTAALGPAAARLRDRLEDADLLVVGSRGHGGFAGLLLGSVSGRCVAHPEHPVAVIGSQ